jgi:hypothetical protein
MAELTPGRVLGRRRRANVEGGRPGSPIKVRVSEAERAELVARCREAGGITVQRLLVESALSGGAGSPSERRAVVVELFGLRRTLSGMAVNLNQAARRANVGDGFPVEDVRGVLLELRRLAGPGGAIDAAIDRLAAEGVRGL